MKRSRKGRIPILIPTTNTNLFLFCLLHFSLLCPHVTSFTLKMGKEEEYVFFVCESAGLTMSSSFSISCQMDLLPSQLFGLFSLIVIYQNQKRSPLPRPTKGRCAQNLGRLEEKSWIHPKGWCSAIHFDVQSSERSEGR